MNTGEEGALVQPWWMDVRYKKEQKRPLLVDVWGKKKKEKLRRQ
jgi:hypothetical protein